MPVPRERNHLRPWPRPLLVYIGDDVPATVRDDRPHETCLRFVETAGQQSLLSLVTATGCAKGRDVGVGIG
jgi:hypothetical protein